MFIYQILNTVNNKRYIGQSIQRDKQRLWEHKTYLKNGTHQNRHLQRAWNKYGSDKFEFSILCIAKTLSELNELEEDYISKFNTLHREFGYNIRGGGNNRFLSDETKRLISKNKTGVSVHTEKSKKLIADASRNRIHTTESRKKRSKKLKGYKWPEYVKNQWAISQRKGQPYPVLISPNGEKYKVVNMTQFCKTHNLIQQSMSRLVNKQLRHHHGWKLCQTK